MVSPVILAVSIMPLLTVQCQQRLLHVIGEKIAINKRRIF